MVLSNGSQTIINATVDRTNMTIGDILTLKMEVQRPETMKVQFPSFTDKLGVWTVRQAKQAAIARTRPGWSVETCEIQLTIYQTGNYEIPPLEVQLLDSHGKSEKLSSKVIPISVQSVLSGSDESLIELKPQAEIPPDYKPFLMTVAAILATSILIYQLVRHFRKRKHREAIEIVDRRTPEEIAREAIRRLLERKLIEQGQYKNFYLEISEIIKKYLGSRLGIISLERTTEEFMVDLRSTTLSPGQVELIRQFLNDCDLVKFAKYHPSGQEVNEIVHIAGQTIEATEQELAPLVLASEGLAR